MRFDRRKKSRNMTDVEVGEIFLYEDCILIKTDWERDDGGTVCVDLETGETSFFYPEESVEIVTGTLTLD